MPTSASTRVITPERSAPAGRSAPGHRGTPAPGSRRAGDVIVVKLGGAALAAEGVPAAAEGVPAAAGSGNNGRPAPASGLAAELVNLAGRGLFPVVVHGGGPEISALARRLGLQPRFVGGLRVTDDAMLEAAELALVGQVNRRIVAALWRAGARAVGLCGKDGGLLLAERMTEPDLGWVGRIVAVDPSLLWLLLEAGYLPVVAPVAMDAAGRTLNCNADTAAGRVAAALGARRLVFVSDVPGVLTDPADPSSRLPSLTAGAAERLLAGGTCTGGMIPKVRACLDALAAGVPEVRIVDGREPGVLGRAAAGRDVGTLFHAEEAAPWPS